MRPESLIQHLGTLNDTLATPKSKKLIIYVRALVLIRNLLKLWKGNKFNHGDHNVIEFAQKEK